MKNSNINTQRWVKEEIYTEKEAKEALNIAKQIYKFVKSKIKL